MGVYALNLRENKNGIQERKKILNMYWELYREWSDLGYRMITENESRLILNRSILDDRLYKLRNAYEDSLEFSDISRNPFTGEALSYRIDTAGLDGLWWDYELPVRPFEYAIAGFWSISGALRLNGKTEDFPFKCKPGPDVPFLFKELIEIPELVAVISQLEIGNHTGYPIVYFTESELEGYFNYNSWGANYGISYDSSYSYRWFNHSYLTEDCDFDLEKWIKAGKLFWIAPGDSELKLMNTVENCPYLNLAGEKRLKTIVKGNVYYEEEMDYELE